MNAPTHWERLTVPRGTWRHRRNESEIDAVDITQLNRDAWDHAVEQGDNPHTYAVTPERIAEARAGRWSIGLSESRMVPADWFPPIHGRRVLALAAGGGQQASILAAAGAQVTLLDASPGQLAQDAYVADRDGLEMTILEGDMADLSALSDASFDLIVNPVSTLFVPDLTPVWRGCQRVLVSGGVLMTGFMNPDEFIFDADALDERNEFVVRYPLPYVEHQTLDETEIAERVRRNEMFHFSHTMEAQLGGLLSAGFVITGFYEDRRSEADGNPIRHFMPSVFVVRAVRG